MSYQEEIIQFINQKNDILSLLPILKCIPIIEQKPKIIEFIKHSSLTVQRNIYYNFMPISLILPRDIIQYIISFNNVNDSILINKLFHSLTIKNENKYYASIYDSIEDKM